MVSSDDSVVVISRQRTGEFSQGASAIASSHNSAPAGTGRPGQTLAYSRRSNSNTLHVSTPTADTLTNGTIHGGLSIEEDALAIEKRRHQEVRKLLKSTETRIEQLQKEIDDKNGDLDGFRENARDLKDQLEAANKIIADQVATLRLIEAKAVIQTDEIKSLEDKLGSEVTARQMAELQFADSREELEELEELRTKLLISDSKSGRKQGEIDSLRAELASAKEAILARDEALRKSDKEKKDLQTSLFDLKHQMENATAVMGEASMALHSEVTKFLSSLQSTNKLELPLPTMPRR